MAQNVTHAELIGQRVRVYYNLHRDCWSVLLRGRVVAHAAALTLSSVAFRVSEAGRQRVLRERAKNVHAFAEGVLESLDAAVPEDAPRVSYSPYAGAKFFAVGSRAPVDGCATAWLTGSHVLAEGIVYAAEAAEREAA